MELNTTSAMVNRTGKRGRFCEGRTCEFEVIRTIGVHRQTVWRSRRENERHHDVLECGDVKDDGGDHGLNVVVVVRLSVDFLVPVRSRGVWGGRMLRLNSPWLRREVDERADLDSADNDDVRDDRDEVARPN